MKQRKLSLCLVLGIVASNASGLRAQPTNPPPNRPFRQGPGPAGALGLFGPGYERLRGVLTEDQRASLRAAMEEQREKVRALEEKLRDARKEIFEAGLTKKFDEAAVREKAMDAAKLEAGLTVLRVKAFSQMRPELSAEQIEKLTNLGPPGGENPDTQQKRRPDRKRDENGLPLKERPPADKAPEK